MKIDSDERTAEGDNDASAKHPRTSAAARIALWTLAGLLVIGAIGLFVAWRSLTAIERVPFDQSEARTRLEAVPDDRVEEFQAQVEAAEAAAVASEQEDDSSPVDEEDLLEGARDALGNREVSSNFEVPFASSPPVDDSVYDSYLLIGSDLSGALADVIIYVLNPTQPDGSPIMVSLPRDLYLPNPCTRSNTRLNAALNGCGEYANGPELLGLMVEDFTGVPVDHFATVDFEGFTAVVDAFGGYEICVDHPVRDAKAFLELGAGCTEADGETVLAWVRSRQTQELVEGGWRRMEGVSDFSRQARQQEVLLGIASKLRSFGSVTAFSQVVARLQESVTFDAGLDFAALIDTAWDNRDVDLATIERVDVPFEDYTVDLGELKAYVLVPGASFEQTLANTTIALDEAGGT
ncbi:MAG: LCP family protein [Acidimicrobiia bacterium]|nr:LCP family protein [Acidimicrobiia bacterium]